MSAKSARRTHSTYEPLPIGESFSRRIIHFLLWAKDNSPNEVFDPEEIVYFAFSRKSLPRATDTDVVRLVNNKSYIGSILEKQHKTMLLALRGSGWRATDLVGEIHEYLVKPRHRRYESGRKKLISAVSLSDGTSKMLKGNEKEWRIGIESLSKQLRVQGSLEPAPKKADEGDDDK